MAAGLPVIADNRYGAKDRVTPETGWLVDDYQSLLEVVREIIGDLSVLKTKGEAARQRAREHFVMGTWVDAILDRK
jgi:glycosyltransferase involved in cell wall biosynthesis